MAKAKSSEGRAMQAKMRLRRKKRREERGYEPLRYKFKSREGYTMGPHNISPRHRVIQEQNAKKENKVVRKKRSKATDAAIEKAKARKVKRKGY